MVSYINKAFKIFFILINKILYPRYDAVNSAHPTLLIFKLGIIQKVLGINRHVPWPVHWSSQINCPERINPGTRTPGLAIGCYFDGRNGINIGNNVWIGPRVSIISMNHKSNNYEQYINDKPVQIEDNCWIATNAIILSGVRLGPHTIVAAGSIVTKSFSEGNQIIGGNPAKVIKELSAYDV